MLLNYLNKYLSGSRQRSCMLSCGEPKVECKLFSDIAGTSSVNCVSGASCANSFETSKIFTNYSLGYESIERGLRNWKTVKNDVECLYFYKAFMGVD